MFEIISLSMSLISWGIFANNDRSSVVSHSDIYPLVTQSEFFPSTVSVNKNDGNDETRMLWIEALEQNLVEHIAQFNDPMWILSYEKLSSRSKLRLQKKLALMPDELEKLEADQIRKFPAQVLKSLPKAYLEKIPIQKKLKFINTKKRFLATSTQVTLAVFIYYAAFIMLRSILSQAQTS